VTNEIALLLCVVDQAYDRRSWHGPNLRGSVRGLDVDVASWRPAAGRHNVWEHVVHAAYWKYIVRRRLVGAKRGTFPLTGSNWFVRPDEPTLASWKADVAILDDQHRQLRAVVAVLSPADLRRKPAGSTMDVQAVVTCIAAHDVYHAGQIQLLKRLYAESARA
jgi:hypothetical protein